jgi:predicted metal-dependent hydrolase
MKLLRFGFVVGMSVQVIASLLGDRTTYRWRVLLASWRRFRRSPLMSRQLWDQLRDYDRPDFHPDDRDATELVERWRTELFGSDGSLNDKLVANAG